MNDAVAWHNAPWSIIDSVVSTSALEQLLRRAAIYQLITADRIATATRPDTVSTHLRQHERVADLVDTLRRA